MVTERLCIAGLEAANADGVIRALALRLLACGHVHPSFEKAALTREKRSPTGLPFEGAAVALPHAEPEHVVSPAIAVATLTTPVRFRQMGDPATQLSVQLVVMPALTQKQQAAGELARLLELLQSAALRQALLAAIDPAAMCRILNDTLGEAGG